MRFVFRERFMYINYYDSPVGRLLLAARGDELVGLWREGQRYFAAGLIGERREGETPALRRAARWLDGYFAGEEPGRNGLTLFPAGTPFQRRVWALLEQIPYGRVTTYGGLAKALGLPPGGARAVGGAVGRNPISILIPCHRVVGAGGALTGYAGGLEMKEWLLVHEGAQRSDMWDLGQ